MRRKNVQGKSMYAAILASCLVLTATPWVKAEEAKSGLEKKSRDQKMAQAKKMREQPMGVVVGSNGGVFPIGKYAAILRYYHLDYDQMYQGTNKIDLPSLGTGSGASKQVYERSLEMVNLVLRAGILENVDVRALIPFRDKEMKMRTAMSDITQDNSGFGDIKLISRYRLMSQKAGDPLNLAVGLGVELPTGSTDSTHEGSTQPYFLQGGSGSWDPIFEIGAHKVMGANWLSAHVMYQINTEGELGSNDFEAPDQLNYNLGYMHALSQYLDLGVEVNGEARSKAELNGVEQTSTGGHSVYITPELNIKFGHGVVLGLSMPIAVYHDLNGTQVGDEYRIAAKLAYFF